MNYDDLHLVLVKAHRRLKPLANELKFRIIPKEAIAIRQTLTAFIAQPTFVATAKYISNDKQELQQVVNKEIIISTTSRMDGSWVTTNSIYQ